MSQQNDLNVKLCALFIALLCVCFLSMSFFNWKLRESAFTTDRSSRVYIQSSLGSGRYLSTTVAAHNRLGNRLFGITALVSISRALQRTPLFWVEDENYASMLEETKRFIPGIFKDIRVVYGKKPVHDVETVTYPYPDYRYNDPEKLKSFNGTILHLTGFLYQSWKFFSNLKRNEILSYLTTSIPHFKDLPASNSSSVVTCVHIRRTDFLQRGWHVADENFIRKSVEFIHSKKNLKRNQTRSVVMLGDDPEFMGTIFPNSTRHFISTNSPPDDLLYSSQHCDTVFYTSPVSTFGFWMGYLSKGNKVYYTDPWFANDVLFVKRRRLLADEIFLPEWTALKFDESNSTVLEAS